jgi:TnpA family transposase
MRQQFHEVLPSPNRSLMGTASASLLQRKLGTYARQNHLALALREIGRLERTRFMLHWMQDPSPRRRVHQGLNKGEARNSLARAVFFHRLGEVRDRSYENQRYRCERPQPLGRHHRRLEHRLPRSSRRRPARARER